MISEKEIEELRKHRHAYGNTLTAHELEIKLLQQAVSDGHSKRIEDLEEGFEEHGKELEHLRSDVRILVWRVGAVTGFISGAVVFTLNFVVNHLLK